MLRAHTTSPKSRHRRPRFPAPPRRNLVPILGPFSGPDFGTALLPFDYAVPISGPPGGPSFGTQFGDTLGALLSASCSPHFCRSSQPSCARFCGQRAHCADPKQKGRRASGAHPCAYVAGPSVVSRFTRTMRDASCDPFFWTVLWAPFRGRMPCVACGARVLEMFVRSRPPRPAVGQARFRTI